MNIPQEEKALEKLPPQKYTIRILVIAVSFLVTGYPVLWGVMNNMIKDKDREIKQCGIEKVRNLEKMQTTIDEIRVEYYKKLEERNNRLEHLEESVENLPKTNKK